MEGLKEALWVRRVYGYDKVHIAEGADERTSWLAASSLYREELRASFFATRPATALHCSFTVLPGFVTFASAQGDVFHTSKYVLQWKTASDDDKILSTREELVRLVKRCVANRLRYVTAPHVNNAWLGANKSLQCSSENNRGRTILYACVMETGVQCTSERFKSNEVHDNSV